MSRKNSQLQREKLYGKEPEPVLLDSGYLLAMSRARGIDKNSSLAYMLPIILFSSVIVALVRMKVYYLPFSQFYWTTQTNKTQISDFFSYVKMELIIITAITALLMMLFTVMQQTFAVKKTWFYIPMLVYAADVAVSYFASDLKDFALLGWDGRFEGTLTLLSYMVVLFLIINAVNTEKNVKQIIWPLGVSSAALGMLGVTQALDIDFFRTKIGQKMLVPNWDLTSGKTFWETINEAAQNNEQALKFTFNNKEIYQTVYNINYVSFYLCLLVPLFAMLFIRVCKKESNEPTYKKILLGLLLGLLVFNLIGSASSGGYLGLGAMIILALILLNKQLFKFIKPLLIILLIFALVMGMTYNRWWPELSNAVKSVLNIHEESVEEEAKEETAYGPATKKPFLDYFKTDGSKFKLAINGNPLTLNLMFNEKDVTGVEITDESGRIIDLEKLPDKAAESGDKMVYAIKDDRFYEYMTIAFREYKDMGTVLTLRTLDEYFMLTPVDGQIKFMNQIGKTLDVDKVDHFGFEDNYGFGSGRGYIWSRSIPMLKDTILYGYGADCYCGVFPQNDYAGRYNAGYTQTIIIDKPHNMYLHMGICTGGISLLAALTLYGGYIIQSIKLLWKREYGTNFLAYTSAGILFGITAFLIAGLVNDSTVSVMPMFYSMLGIGIAVNIALKRQDMQNAAPVSEDN